MQIITEGNLPKIPDFISNFNSLSDVGIAVDIGTTTVVVTVWQLSTRKNLAIVAEKNAQCKYGSDVINRIDASIKLQNGEKLLHDCIVNQLEKMFSAAISISSQKLIRGIRPYIRKIVITGNTTMLSFVAKFSVKKIATVPFLPESKFDFETDWKNISDSKISVIPQDVKVYFPPVVGAFIGADTVCALLASDFDFDSKTPFLLSDIGTNSEIALFLPKNEKSDSKILCTAAAAGPAFEGANIEFGMTATSGAIEKIFFENEKIFVSTIDNIKAKGICGSGLISSICVFLENRFIDKDGMILKTLENEIAKINLTEDVFVSQNDIRNFQLAKSAVRTGIDFLLEKIDENNKEDIKFFIAGGFGSKIDLFESCKIGLFSDSLLENTIQIGNAALFGATSLLFSDELKNKIKIIAKKSIQINLAAIPNFQDKFLKNLSF